MHKKDMIKFFVENGNMNETDANRVYKLYIKEKIFKFCPSSGVNVVHGGFLDADVLERAVKMAEERGL